MLTGTGADGAYHAGVLRALREAGVKIDLVCGRGIGAVAAVFAAVDGAGRLWDPRGLWRAESVGSLYGWRRPIAAVFAIGALTAIVLSSPVVLVILGVLASAVGLLLGMAGLEFGAEAVGRYAAFVQAAFAPSALPTWVPRLVTVGILAAVAILAAASLAAARGAPAHRLSRRSPWALVGAPLDGARAARYFAGGLWDLLRGGAPLKAPRPEDLSRRYTELLADNLGQPGFSELLLTIHDVDARRDLVFGLVREPFRRALFAAPAPGTARRAEAFDLGGLARDHLIDVIRAALAVPVLTAPSLIRFGAETYWRGEAHHVVDRPGALARLLEEAAAAGAEQVIVVAASPAPPGPHELSRPRLDPLGRAGAYASSMEAAALRDATEHLQHRFRAFYVIRPSHNPVRPFDLRGAYDERSDRHHSLAELMERGYEDAHHAFIEPVVAASGDRLTEQ